MFQKGGGHLAPGDSWDLAFVLASSSSTPSRGCNTTWDASLSSLSWELLSFYHPGGAHLSAGGFLCYGTVLWAGGRCLVPNSSPSPGRERGKSCRWGLSSLSWQCGPAPSLWEQLGNDGRGSGDQKGEQRIRDSSLWTLWAAVLCWGLPKQSTVRSEVLRFVFWRGKLYTKCKENI